MYKLDSIVRYSEVGSDRLITITSVINYFQDCGALQFEALGLGVDYYKKTNKACLASSWQFVINRLPRMGEHITVGSIIYDCKGIFGYRNYMIYDEAGNSCVSCNSIGVFVDATTGKPLRLTEEEIKKYPIEEKLDMDYLPRKIMVPSDTQDKENFKIHKYHIDTNKHVNNAQYVAMAEEFIPKGYSPKKVRVEYKNPAVYGDVLTPKVSYANSICVVALCDQQDKPYAVVEFS